MMHIVKAQKSNNIIMFMENCDATIKAQEPGDIIMWHYDVCRNAQVQGIVIYIIKTKEPNNIIMFMGNSD